VEYTHQPVQAEEVLQSLIVTPDGLYVDGTVGTGGHSEIIGKEISSKGRLICLDRDSEAIRVSSVRLAPLGSRVTLVKANYAKMDEVLQDLGFGQVNGVLLDLGISSHQIEISGRGFSFNRDEALDMRFDCDDQETACQLVNTLSSKDLKMILKGYGEEKKAGLIANAVVKERKKKAITSSLQLAKLIQSVVHRPHHSGGKHPATKSFQALRIAVNRELENLKEFFDKAPFIIQKGGHRVIISYN